MGASLSRNAPIALPDNFPVFVRPPGLPATCSDAQLLEAAKAYLCGTDPETLAKMLGVPVVGLRYWTDSREWGQLIEFIRPEVAGILIGQTTRVASLALVQLEDRLVKGDQVFNQQGEYVGRREIRGKDLAEIATKVLEQQKNLERSIGKITDDDNALSLKKLAAALTNYAEAKPEYQRFASAQEIKAEPV
jgi:hypothetical protein